MKTLYKTNYQKNLNDDIQILLKRIAIKCENFASKNCNTWHGDLGLCLEDLKEIDSFINDKYLTK